MKIFFSHQQYLTPEVLTMHFKPVSNFEYLAGQYVELTFPDEHFSSIGDNRWFTLSSSPSEDDLAVTTRVIKPLSDFKERFIHLSSNQEMIMSEPIGDFVLPMDKTIPIVFICGGIGVTPVRSIIKWLIDNNEQRTISIKYIVRHDKDLVFSHLFKDYKMSFEPIVTSEPEASEWNTNTFLRGTKPNSMYYVSGPQLLVEDIVDDLVAKFGSNQVVMDYFPGYSTI